MTIPSITALPPAPLRSQSPSNFTTTAETFVDALGDFVTETNAAIDEINALSFSTNSWKGAVRVATTANGTLASAFADGQTIDGVTLVTGDRILLKNQTTQTENGLYVVAASGAPTRAADFNTNDEVLGAVVFVIAGSANAGKIFYSTNTAAVTIGSSNLTFAEFSSGSSIPEASASEIWTGTETAKYISPDKLFDSAAPQTLTDAATIAVDMATGINFNVTLGGNRTLGNPTNAKAGQSGRIRVVQDGTGSRTLAFAANWKHVGSTPTIATAAAAVDLFAYFVNDSSNIELSYLGTLA